MSHTPGPWKVERADSDGANVVAIAQVAWCGTNGSWSKNEHQFISAKEAKANAHLIAAAPDLLEALIAAETVLTFEHGGEPLNTRNALFLARAAIAKAKGDS